MIESVGERKGHVDIGRVVGVVAAVQTPDGAVALAAVDGDGDRLVAVLGAGEVATGSGCGTARERDQAGDLARSGVERKLGNLALIDSLFEFRVLGLEGETFGFNRDGLLCFTEGETGVDVDVGSDLEDVVDLGVGLEAGVGDGQGVRADDDIGEDVGTGAVRFGRVDDVCGFFGEGDGRAGQKGSGGISDRALDGAGAGYLCAQDSSEQSDRGECKNLQSGRETPRAGTKQLHGLPPKAKLTLRWVDLQASDWLR